MTTDTNEVPEITVTPGMIRSIIFEWAKDNYLAVIGEAKRRNITPLQFIVMMLDDALDAYQNSEVVSD